MAYATLAWGNSCQAGKVFLLQKRVVRIISSYGTFLVLCVLVFAILLYYLLSYVYFSFCTYLTIRNEFKFILNSAIKSLLLHILHTSFSFPWYIFLSKTLIRPVIFSKLELLHFFRWNT